MPFFSPDAGWAVAPLPVHRAAAPYIGNPETFYDNDPYYDYVPSHYTSGESFKTWQDLPTPQGSVDPLPSAAKYHKGEPVRALLSPETHHQLQELQYDHYSIQTAALQQHDVSFDYPTYGNAYLPSPDALSDGSPPAYVKQEEVEEYDGPVEYLFQEKEEPEHQYLFPPDTDSDSDGDAVLEEEEEYKPHGVASRKPKAKKAKAAVKGQQLYGRAPPLAKPTAKARIGAGPSSSKGENSPEVSQSRSAAAASPVKRGSPSTSPLTSRHALVARRQPSMEAGKRFIEKIFHFLQDPAKYDNLIQWDDSETVVLIAHKDPAFPKMLESHFGHKNFSAFARQFAVYNCQAQTKRTIRLLTLNGQSLDGRLRDEYRGWKHKSGEFCGKTIEQDLPFFVATPSRARREAKEKREMVHRKRLASWTAPMEGYSAGVEYPVQMKKEVGMEREGEADVEGEPEREDDDDDDLMSEEDVLRGPT